MNTERYLNMGELMDTLGISRSTVYRLMAKRIPKIMVGSVQRFPVNQVVGWLQKQGGNNLDNRKHAVPRFDSTSQANLTGLSRRRISIRVGA
jgi:excisionase family DNA binding protein